MSETQPDTVAEAHSGYYRGIYIEFIGGQWRPYRIWQPVDNQPRYFTNLNEAKGFIFWWLEQPK